MLEPQRQPENGPSLEHRRGSGGGSWSPTVTIRTSIGLHGLALAGLLASPNLWLRGLAVVAANHAVLGLLGMLPRNRLLGPNLVRLPEPCARQKLVALCFDDGPDPAVTPPVLDILDRHGATASFFCVGRRAREHPGILRDIIRRGHSVENHTDRHPLGFAAFGMSGMRCEVERAQAALAGITGRCPRFFRGPAGLRSPLLDPVLARCGLRYATWTRRGHDTMSRDPGRILRRLTTGLAAGDILLLHDGLCARTREGQPVVLAVLPDLLAEIETRGLRAVSLPGALAAEPPTSLDRASMAPRAACRRTD